MKKALMTLLAAALIVGSAGIANAKKVEDLNLDISGLAQMGYSFVQSGAAVGDENGIDINRLRLNISAQPADKVAFYAAIEGAEMQNFGANRTGLFATADSRLVDAFVTLTYLDWVTIKAGQMPSPVSYELNTPEYALETIDYSQIVGSMVNRDRGIGLIIPVTDAVGLVVWGLNGEGTIDGATDSIDDSAAYGAMLNVKPLDNLSFKAWGNFAGYTMDGAAMNALVGTGTAGNKTDLDVDALGIGFDWKPYNWHLSGEYARAKMKLKDTTGSLGDDKSKGYVITAGYTIPETGVQLIARYDMLDTTDVAGTSSADAIKIITAGMNWDFEKNCRLQFMHEFKTDETRDTAANKVKDDETKLQLSVRF